MFDEFIEKIRKAVQIGTEPKPREDRVSGVFQPIYTKAERGADVLIVPYEHPDHPEMTVIDILPHRTDKFGTVDVDIEKIKAAFDRVSDVKITVRDSEDHPFALRVIGWWKDRLIKVTLTHFQK